MDVPQSHDPSASHSFPRHTRMSRWMERSMVPWYILEFIVLESAGSTVSLPFQCSKDGIEEEQVDGAAGEGCLIR